MAHLTDILEKNKRLKVDGRLYQWEQLYGLSSIIEFDGQRTKIGPVEVEKANHDYSSYDQRNPNLPWCTYGDRLQYVDEALLYSDGSILLAASVSSWGGTFTTHDDVSIKYYSLTPIEKKAVARQVRKAKKK